MSEFIKTGFCIDGVEVTSEHIGKKLEVLESDDDDYLPVGFVTVIKAVYESGVLLQDTSGSDNYYAVDIEWYRWKFKWATLAEPKKSGSKRQRQKIAKTIRDAKAALDLAVRAAEEVGMVVNISKDCVKITFNPPAEEY